MAACPLCTASGRTTAEDVLPIWVRRTLLGIVGLEADQQAPARLTLRICQSCNGRLGAVFENIAAPILKPMMTRQSVSLTPAQQKIVASWLLKTTLLHLFAVQARHDVILADPMRSMLLRLIDDPTPPPGTSIRICRVATRVEEQPAKIELADLLPDERPLVGYYNVSWQGAVGFEVLVGDPLTLRPFIIASDRSGVRFIRLWPPRASRRSQVLTWPPKAVVGQEELLAVRSAWASRTPSWEPPPIEHSWEL